MIAKNILLSWLWRIGLLLLFGSAVPAESFLTRQTEEKENTSPQRYAHGGIIRGRTEEKCIYLTFTGHEFAEGGETILRVFRKHKIQGSFFFTGDFYRNPKLHSLIRKLYRQGHYLGPHSDKHLLYAAWEDRNRLLVDKKTFQKDLLENLREMEKLKVRPKRKLFLPPYEWYNRTIADWTAELGFTLINYTPGTISHADYTSPLDGKKYRSSRKIYEAVLEFEKTAPQGLNGFILLSHIGAGPARSDKFFLYLDSLIGELKKRGYQFSTLESLPE